jgi:uncharacterized protein YjdB
MRAYGWLFVLAAMVAAGCDDGQGPDAVVHMIEVTPQTAVVMVGDTVELTARPKGPDGAVRMDIPVEWVSRDTALATVSGTAQVVKVLARKAGLAEVNAGAYGKIGVATLEIRNGTPAPGEIVPAVVTAGGTDFTLIVKGSRFAPGAQVLVGGVVRTTEYVSAAELRAVVHASDVATAGDVQIQVINAAPGGGTSDALTLTVAPAGVAYVDMQPNAVTVAVGATVTLSATARDAFGRDLQLPLSWSSSNPQVASADGTGKVTGVADGVAIIRATTESGTAGTAVVNVEGPAAGVPVITSILPDSVESNPDGLEIMIEGSGFVENSGAFINGSGRPTEYISATSLKMFLWPGDLSSSSTPQIRVFNPGTGGGMSAGVALRIVPGVWSIRFDVDMVELWPGKSQTVVATAYDEQDRPLTGRDVTWAAGNGNVATVGAEGRITAVSAGSTLVSATIGNRTMWLQVRVLAPLPWDVLYEGYHGGVSELWLLTPGPDAAARRLLAAGTYAADPAATADGARIAFVGMSTDGAKNIFAVNRDGSDLRQLTHTIDLDDQPAWSRDGSRIAFRSTRNGVSDIYVMDANGASLVNVTRNANRAGGPWAAERPTWTPDGRLVFSFGPQNLNPLEYRLVRSNADGSGWTPLTDGTTFRDFEPEVSPNGELIALRRHSTFVQIIDIIAADGSQLGWLNLPGPGYTPSWSPDGLWLTWWDTVAAGPAGSVIYMTGLHSHERRVLVPAGGRNPVLIPRN